MTSDKPAMFFSFDPEQWEKVQEWERKHDCPFPEGGTIGDRIHYKFTPTGLGMCESAHCACGSEINVTEYDKW